VADIEGARCQQDESREARQRAADATASPPGRNQSEQSDQRAYEPPRLEQRERGQLGGKRGQHVEAAAIHIEIDEGEGAVVGKARAIKCQQQLAVFGMA